MIFDVLGWIGSITLLIAYLLLSMEKIKNGYLYQIMNLAAVVLMAIGLFPKKAWFSFWLQIAFGVIAVWAIVRLTVRGKKKKKAKKV